MRFTYRRSAVTLAALSGFALAGCTAHTQLATQAVSFNRTVEKAQNEMLLLNVIRAKERLPMYLTGISGLTGNLSMSLTGSLTGTYTGTGQQATASSSSGIGTTVTDTLARAYTPSLGGTVSANPTFTLSVLDTQEFMRGFLSPLGKDTLNYYWTQGWPHALLIYLFVQKVEVKDKDKTTVLLNYPDSADLKAAKLQEFGYWVREFLAQEPEIEEVSVPVSIGPILPEEKLTNLSKLVEMSKEGLVLTPAGDNAYQLQKNQTDFRFRFGKKSKDSSPAGQSGDAYRKKVSYLQKLPEEGAKMAISNDDSKTTTFFLRSPEAILYYLGELTRLANRESSPLAAYVCIQDRLQPLFLARPAGACPSILLDAESAQERFAIPRPAPEKLAVCDKPGSLQLIPPACESGRSMHSLSLLSQVISLQKSAKDNPGTALVRIIGN